MKLKIIVIVCSVLAGGIAGIISGVKMAKDPICNCPEFKMPKQQAAIKVNSIDVSELRKLKIGKNFTYAPSFNAETITVVQCDSIKSE